MSKKVLYFTSDSKATSAELAEIATINAIAASPYEVTVLSGKPDAVLTSINLSAAAADNSYNDAGATITATTIAAVASDNSITDSGNGFVTAGFQVGDRVTVTGFTTAANNATRIATIVAAGKITFGGADGNTIEDESAGDTVTAASAGRFLDRGFKKGQTIFVRGFTGDTANNIDSGVVTSLTASKMIIGGTDGDVIANDSAGESVTISTTATGAKFGDAVIVADYVAGTVPEAYKSGGTAIYTVFDPANPPDVAALVETQGVVSHGETVAVKTNGGASSDSATATVSAHAVTVALPATKTVVENGDTTTVDGATVTLAVGSGAVTGGTLAATDCVVSSGDTVAVGSDNVTITVAGNAMTGGSIGATKTIVENADTLALTTAGTVTFGVSGGTLSGDVAATEAVVSDGGTIALGGDNITLGVAAHVVTPSIGATKTILENGDTVAVGTGTATLTVSGGALASAALDATHIVVADTQELTITSGSGTTKVTLTIAGGAITAVVLS